MATDVLMPQMGESIAEGTVVKWLKKVGDKVERDEPLLEISTDKVDAEVPSPAAGVLLEILAKEGETVTVNAVIGHPLGIQFLPGLHRQYGGTARQTRAGASGRIRRRNQSPGMLSARAKDIDE